MVLWLRNEKGTAHLPLAPMAIVKDNSEHCNQLGPILCKCFHCWCFFMVTNYFDAVLQKSRLHFCLIVDLFGDILDFGNTVKLVRLALRKASYD